MHLRLNKLRLLYTSPAELVTRVFHGFYMKSFEAPEACKNGGSSAVMHYLHDGDSSHEEACMFQSDVSPETKCYVLAALCEDKYTESVSLKFNRLKVDTPQ